jgi:dolichol-phosphate mannosyltransferase
MIIDTVFSLPKDFDILIVDDNSPDGTAENCERLAKRLQLRNRNAPAPDCSGRVNKGWARPTFRDLNMPCSTGYDYVLQMDADFSHNPKDLINLYLNCSEWGSDLSVGSRYATGVNVVNWPMGRVLLSFFASKYVQIVTGIPLHDTTAGFVCYRSKVLKTIPLNEVKFIGYAFQIEMKFLTWKYGFKLSEVPIIFTDRTRGQSKMSVGIFKEAFLGVIQMTVQSWFKKYIPA